MKSIKIIITILALCTLYILYIFYLRQEHIKEIYQHSEYSEIWGRDCKSTVILVDNAPLSHDAKKEFWKKNSIEIIKKWAPLTNSCDEILFVKNRIGRVQQSGDLKYWIADNAICLNGIIGGCISWDDRLFYVKAGDPIWKDEVSTEKNGLRTHLNFIN